MQEFGGRIVGTAVYASGLFEAGTIQRYPDFYWKRLLEGMIGG